MIHCQKCKRVCERNFEYQFELHHLIPRRIGGTDKTGRIWLCATCHHSLHKFIDGFMRNYKQQTYSGRAAMREFIKIQTEGWLQ